MNKYFYLKGMLFDQSDTGTIKLPEVEVARRQYVFFISVVFILLLLFSSCNRPQEDISREGERNVRRQLVQTVQVRSSNTEDSPCFSGTAKEGQTIKMSFRVTGPLVEYNVEIGRRVKKGEVLAKIDPRDFELSVSQIEEELKEANAILRAMKTGARSEDIAALEAAVTSAVAQFQTAKKNEERFARLLTTQSVPQLKYDEMKLLYDQAGAALESARQNLNKGKTGARSEDIEAMNAKIAGLNVQLVKEQNALADIFLYAPSDGYVSQKYVENREIITKGIPVLAFTNAAEIRVQTTIPESLLVRQNEFVGYDCEFESYPGRKFKAKLSELGLAQQAGKQGYPLEVTIDSDEKTAIHPGMTAKITIHLKKQKTEFLIPLAAIVGDEEITSDNSEIGEKHSASAKSEKSYVWYVDPLNESLVKKYITIVRLVDEGVIVTGELKIDDRIISAGARFVRENEKVRVK